MGGIFDLSIRTDVPEYMGYAYKKPARGLRDGRRVDCHEIRDEQELAVGGLRR